MAEAIGPKSVERLIARTIIQKIIQTEKRCGCLLVRVDSPLLDCLKKRHSISIGIKMDHFGASLIWFVNAPLSPVDRSR
ncbi:hypothetical protein FS827_14695 [Agrobacterium vitis]|uniref:hypothetical protein n=1 Tax=Allorhizobium ampelinum TaxID=3025782 RepID=UPI001F3E355D|nr:hypothetical protein [Allorhizobium ampelinum]MCF1462560.1 hypothetical protein [Allorhizobium ampelinum]